MSIGNLILSANSVTVSHLVRYDSLLQNAIDIITKCHRYFITICDRSLLQNASGLLLRNATVLLQNATILLQNATVQFIGLPQYKINQLIKIEQVSK